MSTMITNLQRFSITDGHGIRTSVFFKGCPLSCKWCHNPESISYFKELLYDSEKCISCGTCIMKCPQGALSFNDDKKILIDKSKCDACGICTEYCLGSALDVIGKEYSVDGLIKEIEKDRMFYETSDGGVTLSGGESMAQDIDYLEELCRKLKRRGVHIAVDTSGQAPQKNYERILPYVDIFLFDLKTLDVEKHKHYVGSNTELILSNLIYLSENGANINIRIPIIEGVNADDNDIKEMIDFLKENNISVTQINILPYHEIGTHKYDKMGLEYSKDEFAVPSEHKMESIKKMFTQAGYVNTYIGG